MYISIYHIYILKTEVALFKVGLMKLNPKFSLLLLPICWKLSTLHAYFRKNEQEMDYLEEKAMELCKSSELPTWANIPFHSILKQRESTPKSICEAKGIFPHSTFACPQATISPKGITALPSGSTTLHITNSAE